jgi:hypothetical protein
MIIPLTNYLRLRIGERVQQSGPFGSLISVMEG